MFGVWGSGLRDMPPSGLKALGFRVEGLGFRVEGLEKCLLHC